MSIKVMPQPCFCFGIQRIQDNYIMNESSERNKKQIKLVKKDLENMPQWPLTSYAVFPGEASDISGDISFEELRYMEYRQLLEGKSIDEVKHNTSQLIWASNQKFENFIKNILDMEKGAFSFGVDNAQTHQKQERYGIMYNQNKGIVNRCQFGNNMVFGNSNPSPSLNECQPGHSDFSFRHLSQQQQHMPSLQSQLNNVQLGNSSTNPPGFHFGIQNHQYHLPFTSLFTNTNQQQQQSLNTFSLKSENNIEIAFRNKEDEMLNNTKNLFTSKSWYKALKSSSTSANKIENVNETINTAQGKSDDDDMNMNVSTIPSTSAANTSIAMNSMEDKNQNKGGKIKISKENETQENPWTAEFFTYIPEDPPPPEYIQ